MRSFLRVELPRRYAAALAMFALLTVIVGCSMSDLTNVPDPSAIVSPDAAKTPEAGVSMYKGAVSKFAAAYAGGFACCQGTSYALMNGLFADEYLEYQYNPGQGAYNLRNVTPLTMSTTYSDLHTTRLNIDQAIGTLAKYGTGTPPSYIGMLYALKGYVYTMFGELYCSGVPFSYAIFEGDIVLGQAESTEAMLEHAVALFDSAMTIATDSVSTRQLAMIGKARALVDLGRFADAGAVVTETNVPTNYVYAMTYSAQTASGYMAFASDPNTFFVDAFMANRAGSNGLDYVAAGNAGDPRVKSYLSAGFTPEPEPSKFPSGNTPVRLADGIEARLIEAEAALNAGQPETWATILNTLRQTAITPAIPALTADSTTTASAQLRENVMFRERAFWLYGTGHRTGDLRRLVRQYNRLAQDVFPIGVQAQFPSPTNVYGDQVNVAPPMTETTSNPQYHGCLNLDA